MKRITLALAMLAPLALIAFPDGPEAAQDPAILPGCQEWRDVDYLALYPRSSRANRTDRPRITIGTREQIEGYTYQLLPNYCPQGAKPWSALVRAFDYKHLEDAFTDYDPDPALTLVTLAEWSAYLQGGAKPVRGIIFLRVRDFRVYYPTGPMDFAVWAKVLDSNLPQGASGNWQRWDGWHDDGEHGSGEVSHPLTGMDLPCARAQLLTLVDAAALGNVDVGGLLADALGVASVTWEAWDLNDDGTLSCLDVPGWNGDPAAFWPCARTPDFPIVCERDVPAWLYVDSALAAIQGNTW